MLRLKYYKSFEKKLSKERCKKCKYIDYFFSPCYPNEAIYIATYCRYLNKEIFPQYMEYCLYFNNK